MRAPPVEDLDDLDPLALAHLERVGRVVEVQLQAVGVTEFPGAGPER